ncbi:MAG: hypothetical protein IJ796_07930 [Lachnospiraceae bacterium]|nr:hypothetical protein [Lachnospiraceae bacterium]
MQSKDNNGKKVFFTEERLEMFIAIFLGITALLTAWATWIGSLHGGNQATNYTTSNNIAAEGNSMWNEASQQYMQDLIVWNSIVDYQTELEIAEMEGDTAKADIISAKIDLLIYDSCSDEFAEAIEWAFAQEEWASPFDKEGFMDSYYADAQAVLDESQEYLEQGQEDNSNGDRFGLVTVIYSLVLFLLGIVGIFKKLPNRKIVFFVSVAFLLVALIYMFTIPLPKGFTL